MSVKLDYENFLKNKENYKKESTLAHFYFEQWKRYVHPFKIFKDIYYVGDSWVCAHLIDTGSGLLLIDCGNTGATAMLINAIWELGFNPKDVRWMIISHGHVDHFGGANFMRNMFGTKIYMSEHDAKMFTERPEFALIHEADNPCEELFIPDVLIHDGDILKFGDLTIECLDVPGHTEGCIALFWETQDEKMKVKVGYYGGFGFNTLSSDFLKQYGRMDMREVYKKSINRVINREVDLFLGNHCVNNLTLEKMEKIHEDPYIFVDKARWKICLQEALDNLTKLEKEDPINE